MITGTGSAAETPVWRVECIFSIRSVKQEDAGTYRWTKASANKPLAPIFTLFVTDAPTTPRVVAGGIAVLNKPLTLTCLSNSSTVPDNHNLTMNFFWKRNGITQNSSSTSTFNIQSFEWVKEQKFSCSSIEHGAESDESDILSITAERGPNEIRLIPDETRFVKVTGESVNITCKSRISCYPRCKTTWRNKGAVFPSRRLTILNLTSSDQGNYTCHMENKHGYADSHVHIAVEYGPKAADIQHEENTPETSLGSPVTLDCKADCRPPCQFAWSVKATHKASRNILHIPNVQRNETGNYTCRAWNKRGEARATFQLIVIYPAEISVTASNTKPLAGSNISLTCNVDSLPPPQITWLRGNTTLTNRGPSVSEAEFQVDASSNTQMHNYSFRYNIGNAKCLGKVTYTCEVSNGVGTNRSKNIDIDFRCAPFVDETEGVEAIFYRPAGRSDQILFNITANPKPLFRWSRVLLNGSLEPLPSRSIKDLSFISGSSYHLKLVHLDVHKKDEGNYTVMINNSLGKHDINYRLIVQAGPGHNLRTVFTVVLIGIGMVVVAFILIGLTYLFTCGPCRKKRPVRATKATFNVTKNDTNDTEEEQADLWAAVATEQNMLVSIQDAEKRPQDPRSSNMFVETLTYTRLSESEAQRESLSCTTFTDEGQRRSFMCTAFNDVNPRGSLILTAYNSRHGYSRFPVTDQQTTFPYPPLTNEDIQDDCFPYPPVEYEGAENPPFG
ncbi:hemicentin-2-like [Haliotis rubra]|uniref:hemicentin-2-like n=1 Tax=Haliotis rubra TaxID=36100 RepID=UPI001EE632DD|nr:hemicentin-2-like [Haliotis rubra]